MKDKQTITIPIEEYAELRAKANGHELQSKFFDIIRNEITPTEKQKHLPWYEMLAECIKNRQFREKQDPLEDVKKVSEQFLETLKERGCNYLRIKIKIIDKFNIKVLLETEDDDKESMSAAYMSRDSINRLVQDKGISIDMILFEKSDNADI